MSDRQEISKDDTVVSGKRKQTNLSDFFGGSKLKKQPTLSLKQNLLVKEHYKLKLPKIGSQRSLLSIMGTTGLLLYHNKTTKIQLKL